MQKTEQLLDKWLECIEYANEKQLTQFVFSFKSIMYFSEWRKARWSEPKIIVYLEN